jgi:cell wall assembly regulator SMI1
MKDVCCKIIQYLESKKCNDLLGYNKPASESEISIVECKLGISFPNYVKDSYLTFNGQHGIYPFYNWGLIPLENVIKIWYSNKQELGDIYGHGSSIGPVKPYWWQSKWIPIFENGADSYLCLDFDPMSGGQICQLISYCINDETREVQKYTFEELVMSYYKDLLDENITINKNGFTELTNKTRIRYL